MKKYLLSLLVVGLSFIGFSNAYQYQKNNVVDYNGDITVDGWAIIGQFSKFSDSDVCISVYFYNNGNGGSCYSTNSARINALSVSGPRNQVLSKCMESRHVFQGLNVRDVQVYSRPGCSYKISVSQQSVVDGITPNGSSDLTPAIDGLKGTVFELIPYVVFIGIGMFLATIGFYAIRRLVNWLSGKINSNFKSKR